MCMLWKIPYIVTVSTSSICNVYAKMGAPHTKNLGYPNTKTLPGWSPVINAVYDALYIFCFAAFGLLSPAILGEIKFDLYIYSDSKLKVV